MESEDWTEITERGLRKRVQNRLSQRKHRKNLAYLEPHDLLHCQAVESASKHPASLRDHKAQMIKPPTCQKQGNLLIHLPLARPMMAPVIFDPVLCPLHLIP